MRVRLAALAATVATVVLGARYDVQRSKGRVAF